MSKLTKQLLLTTAIFGFSGMATVEAHAAQLVQPFEAEQTTASIEGVTVTPNNQDDESVETPAPAVNDFFHDKNVWVVGDSLAVGWDGAKNVQQPYPSLLNDIIGAQTMHAGYASSGSQISGNSTGANGSEVDLTNNMARVTGDAAFKDAHALLLEIGVNDLNYNSDNNLGYVQQRLQNNIRAARKANPNIVIYGVLPVPAYQLGSNLNVPGKAGYSFNQLVDALTAVYQSFGIPVMDWRDTGIVTDSNHNTTLGDGVVHPTQATYAAMADQLATWMYANETPSEHDSTTTFKSTGWQVNEQGVKQYAKVDGTLATGAVTIDGKEYFFDANHAIVKNKLVTLNGKQYYIGADGARQQGIVSLNNKWYFFGSNNTYYARPFNQSGYLDTNVGWRWFEKGEVFSGFRFYMGTYYWFKDGERQDSGWRSDWGYKYYTDENGRAVQGYREINGVAYDFGNNGTFFERGKASGYIDAGQGWKWYENGVPYTGFQFYMGTYYWFINGVRQDSGWREQWHLKYYTDNNGRAVQGDAYNVAGTYYNFGHDGTFFLRGKASGYVLTNDAGWLWIENGKRYTGFRMYMGAYYYFINGVRQHNKWVSEWGLKYYVGSDGRSVQGSHVKIGNKYYNFGTNSTFFLR